MQVQSSCSEHGTAVEAVEGGMRSAQVGELKAALVAVKGKTKPICVDSYTLWAGAQWLSQWEALHWQGKGEEAWQKEDGKCLVLQAQSHG